MSDASQDPEPRPLTFLVAALWTLLAIALFGLATAGIDAARPGARFDLVTIAAAKVLVYSLVFFGVLRVHEPDASIREVLALRRPPIVLSLLGAVVGFGLSPAAQWVSERVAERYPPSFEETEALTRTLAADTSGKKVALVIALVVVLPVCEELFFRGALFTLLARRGGGYTVALGTVAYEILGGPSGGPQLAWLLPTLLAFAWLRAVSGSVVPSLLARVVFFGAGVVPTLGAEELVVSWQVAAGGAALAVVAFAVSVAVAYRARRAREAEPAD